MYIRGVPEEERKRSREINLRNNGPKLSKLEVIRGYTNNTKSSTKSKEGKLRDPHWNALELNCQKSKTKRECWKQWEKMTYDMQGTANKNSSRYFSRNLVGQKTLGWYMESVERKNCQLNSVSTKPSFKNEGEIKTTKARHTHPREFITSRPAL